MPILETLEKTPLLDPSRINWGSLLQDERALDEVLPLCEEVVRRVNHPIWGYVPDDAPDRNQLAFHMANRMFNLLFGGNQSGKSRAACHELIWWFIGRHPFKKVPKAGKIWVISALYQNLIAGIYKHFKVYCPDWEIAEEGPNVDGWEIPKWTRSRNGAMIWWMSAEGGGSTARKKFQSEDLHAVFLDEEVKEDVKNEVLMRLLAHGGKVFISATMVDSEPWITELETQGDAGDPDVALVRLSSRAAVRAGHIDRGTLRVIMKGLSKEDIEVRVEGFSRKSQGLVYPDFNPGLQLVPPRKIVEPCTRYCAIDPGWDICAVLWAAVFPTTEVQLYRELYLHNADYRTVAWAILKAEGWNWDAKQGAYIPNEASEVIEARVIDPSAFGKNTDGTPRIGHRLPKFGVKMLRPAVNDVDIGIDAVRALMLDRDPNGRPRITVQRHLNHWLRERASYRFPRRRPGGDKADPKAKPIKRADHLMDDTRYLATIPGGLKYKEHPSEQALRATRVLRVRPTIGTTVDVARDRELQEVLGEVAERHPDLDDVGGYGSTY